MISELRMTNRLLAALATRGLEQKEAVILLNAVGMSTPQIATILSVNPNTLRVMLHRARKGHGQSAKSASENTETAKRN